MMKLNTYIRDIMDNMDDKEKNMGDIVNNMDRDVGRDRDRLASQYWC